jgi:hypothetical protein
MVESAKGNILIADAEALVLPGTCNGRVQWIRKNVMAAFPLAIMSFQQACKRGEVNLGEPFVVNRVVPPAWFIVLPIRPMQTGAARPETVEAALKSLTNFVDEKQIRSIAISLPVNPLNESNSKRVYKMVQDAFTCLPNVRVLLFPPGDVVVPSMRGTSTNPPIIRSRTGADSEPPG